MRDRPLVTAIVSILRDEPAGCLDWTGGIDRSGYGRLGHRLAHRVVYEVLVAPIQADLTIDHLCRNTRCVNPEHLEPVTRAENNRRAAIAKLTCVHGHDFSPENTRIDSRGRRVCRTCARRNSESYRLRRVGTVGVE